MYVQSSLPHTTHYWKISFFFYVNRMDGVEEKKTIWIFWDFLILIDSLDLCTIYIYTSVMYYHEASCAKYKVMIHLLKYDNVSCILLMKGVLLLPPLVRTDPRLV